jgi:hypothetical protein
VKRFLIVRIVLLLLLVWIFHSARLVVEVALAVDGGSLLIEEGVVAEISMILHLIFEPLCLEEIKLALVEIVFSHQKR